MNSRPDQSGAAVRISGVWYNAENRLMGLKASVQKWYQLYPKNRWFNIYAWVFFLIMPFFFIFRTMSAREIGIGIILFALFLVAYKFSFTQNTGVRYTCLTFEILISFTLTVAFGYIYFFLFLALFIGEIRRRTPFFLFYSFNIAASVAALVLVIFTEPEIFRTQYSFLIMSVIGVILIPFHKYSRHRQEVLEEKLEDANRLIGELLVHEERQRIARDLHDTLGQKLSLIGMKSDLASKLAGRDAERAEKEMLDVRQTARTALKEVRDLVSGMRGTTLEIEMARAVQILGAAEIDATINNDPNEFKPGPLIDNVLGMCLMEAVTNIVRHSGASSCTIRLSETNAGIQLEVCDDGIGISGRPSRGNGLRGMRERLDFVNGTLHVEGNGPAGGTRLLIEVPDVIQEGRKEGIG
ncbi:Sensor histidine kinase desK [Bhargavaea cecembensis DSE10]|uniref:histidine kinase n=1 Tax=Bhargavaea cecembensis DSE10 TaxID=1235279 RepID=M7N934_9BACL|nr:sensor histidine kinase [Bhargavaea cecembensis]EMR05118.1 Sensor histidine kinase desK [Bhargavaea cecembensis DSE10]